MVYLENQPMIILSWMSCFYRPFLLLHTSDVRRTLCLYLEVQTFKDYSEDNSPDFQTDLQESSLCFLTTLPSVAAQEIPLHPRRLIKPRGVCTAQLY